jgi:chromosome segregation ATPase
MEDTILMENPQQTIDQVREATALLELIPRLLEENERLRAQAEAATKEADQLRAENAPLRAEVQRCRAEREELGEAFGRVMGEMGHIMGEFAPRFRSGQRPSPFAREPHGHGTNGALNGGANGTTSQH